MNSNLLPRPDHGTLQCCTNCCSLFHSCQIFQKGFPPSFAQTSKYIEKDYMPVHGQLQYYSARNVVHNLITFTIKQIDIHIHSHIDLFCSTLSTSASYFSSKDRNRLMMPGLKINGNWVGKKNYSNTAGTGSNSSNPTFDKNAKREESVENMSINTNPLRKA